MNGDIEDGDCDGVGNWKSRINLNTNDTLTLIIHINYVRLKVCSFFSFNASIPGYVLQCTIIEKKGMNAGSTIYLVHWSSLFLLPPNMQIK